MDTREPPLSAVGRICKRSGARIAAFSFSCFQRERLRTLTFHLPSPLTGRDPSGSAAGRRQKLCFGNAVHRCLVQIFLSLFYPTQRMPFSTATSILGCQSITHSVHLHEICTSARASPCGPTVTGRPFAVKQDASRYLDATAHSPMTGRTQEHCAERVLLHKLTHLVDRSSGSHPPGRHRYRAHRATIRIHSSCAGTAVQCSRKYSHTWRRDSECTNSWLVWCTMVGQRHYANWVEGSDETFKHHDMAH